MSTKVWDIKQLAVIWGVAAISDIGGYGEDVSIEWKQIDPSFEAKSGADGTITRSATNAKLAEIKIHLMQTSPLNQILSGVLLTDRNTPGGAGIMPLSIKDLQGSTLLSCPNTWIVGPPDCPFGKAAAEREWTMNGEIALILVGGN